MQCSPDVTPIASPEVEVRPPCDIAASILQAIPKSGSAWIFCRPYLEALRCCADWDFKYGPGEEAARDLALRFLANSGNWRGVEARKLKDEVRAALGMKKGRTP